jgi:glutathione S-transferase
MEPLLAGQEYFADMATYADIAFYMAQFFAARHTVPMSAAHPRLLAWRARVAERPAVRPVIGAMAAYLRSIGRPVPDFA